ncbi:LysR family transcriptional regulator [Sphingomonas sp. So64.6b]|uniref:LysR family transcriptional regulator n=1 Tax=Sphingomonas sp. So64.6b TaxID=2997354 RepID=UPI0015FEEF7A|nr:LysR family transcriptional regulator [Sphingomonas sp. So64.6b]QNA82996.1 LysR family transcriptional regulator [Sphingomonas sp. So64.6b]
MPNDNLRRYDLNQLVVLRALLDTANVTRAAAMVGLSQPGMSRALSRLRADFGDPLLIRSGAAMRRTPRGEALRDTIGVFLDHAAELYRPEAFVPAKAERVFRAAMPDVVATTLLAPLFEILAIEAPRTRLEVVAWPGLAAGRKDEIDFAISTEPQVYDGFRMHRLYSDHDLLIHRKARACDHDAGDSGAVLALPHIAVIPAALAEDPVEPWLRSIGLARNIVVTVPTYLQAAHLASRSDLVAIVPTRFAATIAGPLGLAEATLPIDQSADPQWLLYPARLETDPASIWLRGLIKRIV